MQNEEYKYSLYEQVKHQSDACPFVVVGIREKELELQGDFSGGTHNIIQRSWVPRGEVQPLMARPFRIWTKIVPGMELPAPDTELLLVTDYSKYGRPGKNVIAGFLRHTDASIRYGGPSSIIGTGTLTGHYWSLPAIIPFDCVSHIMLKPELPND